jgi:tetratricopeptide (TPR) repeat protein
MRNGLTAILILATATALPGCQMLSRHGPVSRSMVQSRQLCQQGIAAMERDQWEEAEGLLSEAVEACSENHDSHRHYAEVLWRKGRRAEAMEHLEQARLLAVDDASLMVTIAEKRLALEQVEAARRSAQNALDLDPQLPEAWAARGRVRCRERKLRLALADYHRALGFAPDDSKILIEVAELYAEMGCPQQSLAALHKAANTGPPGSEPQRLLYLEGLAYSALGRYDEAVDSLAAAAAQDNPTPDILFRLGEAELLDGQPARAAAAAQHALFIDPGHQPSLQLLDRVRLARVPDQRRAR